MPAVLIRGGVEVEIPNAKEIRHSLAEELDARQRHEVRGKKRIELMLPISPAAATAFVGGTGQGMGVGPEEGYVWSLKTVGVNFSAASTLNVYKASSTGDTRRPLAAIPSVPGTTFTTTGNPAVPGSTVAVQNPTNQTYQVVISAGTLTAVVVNGITVGTGDGTYFVPAYGSISVTYTVAPTWVWTATQTNIPGLTLAAATWSADQARLRHGEGVYLVSTTTITGVYLAAWQVPAELEAEIYD